MMRHLKSSGTWPRAENGRAGRQATRVNFTKVMVATPRDGNVLAVSRSRAPSNSRNPRAAELLLHRPHVNFVLARGTLDVHGHVGVPFVECIVVRQDAGA